MLDVRRNLHDIADRKAPRLLVFLLIPSLARDADENLTAPFCVKIFRYDCPLKYFA